MLILNIVFGILLAIGLVVTAVVTLMHYVNKA